MTFARFSARPRAALLLAAGAALLAHGSASADVAKTILVPLHYPTIQDAVDHALQGDTVRVSAGNYDESVVLDGRIALSLIGDPAATIDGGPDEPAILVTGGTAILIQGFALASGTDALRLESTTAPYVTGVRVESAGGDGIRAEAVEGAVTVTASRIDRTAGAGIRVDVTSNSRGDVTITHNVVRATGGDGIFAYSAEDRSNLVIQDNDVGTAGGYGIRTDCGYASVQQNTVAGTGLDGISVYRSRADGAVTGNTISGAGDDGVSIEGTPGAIVQSNTITGAAGDGIDVAGPGVWIRGNTIVDAGAAGVHTTEVFARDRAPGAYYGETVAENRIEGSGTAGIVIVDGVGIAVASNEVLDAGGTAILVSGSQLTVADNTIERPAADGIDVLNYGGERGVVVTGNAITGAGVDGVDLGSSDGVFVARNRVDGSGDCGFRIDDGAEGNVLRRNVATECASFGLMESDGAGRNRITKNNRFGRSHRRDRHRR